MKSKGSCYAEILYPKRFLEIVIQLNKPATKIFDSHSKINHIFSSKTISFPKQKNKKIFIYRGDRYISDMIIAEYERRRGFFYRHDCIEGIPYIIENKFGYIFDNFDSLLPYNRSNLKDNLVK